MEGRLEPPPDDGPEESGQGRRPRGHFLRRLAVLFMIGLLLVLGLEAAAPPLAGPLVEDASLVRYLLFGAIVIFALAASRRSLAAIGGQLAVWLGILLLVVVGYSYRDELRGVVAHVAGDLVPSQGRTIDARTIAFPVSADRQYWIDATVDGKPVRFVVDTGASGVVLNQRDAARLGFTASDLAFTQTFSTANGRTRGAPVRLADLRIGPIAMTDVPASVNEGDLDQSLLGMRFLEKLAEVTIRNGVMTLRQ
jgi:aspartyl protease family protein